MKIAAACEGKQIFGHFGHCENFMIFDAENGRITAEKSRITAKSAACCLNRCFPSSRESFRNAFICFSFCPSRSGSAADSGFPYAFVLSMAGPDGKTQFYINDTRYSVRLSAEAAPPISDYAIIQERCTFLPADKNSFIFYYFRLSSVH